MEQLLQSDLISHITQFFQNFEIGNITSGIKQLANANLPDHIPGSDQVIESAHQALDAVTTGAVIVALVFALLGCFFGYKMLKFWISLAGLLIGAAAGFGIVYHMTDNVAYGITAAVIGAVLAAFLAYKIYLAGVFVLFGFGAYFLSAAYLPLEGFLLTAASIAIGIIVGILAVVYMRPAIIVITGLQNGLIAAGSLIKLIPKLSPTTVVPLGVGLAVLGMAFQFMTTRTKRDRRKRKKLEGTF